MPGEFMSSGVWIIFPIIGIIVMVGFMFLMMSRRGGFWSRPDDYGRSPRGRPSDTRDSDTRDSETPLSILKTRYAKGEISKDEYEEMKAEL